MNYKDTFNSPPPPDTGRARVLAGGEVAKQPGKGEACHCEERTKSATSQSQNMQNSTIMRLPRHSVKKQECRSDLPIRQKAAFTLAEVLITLTIIGVVAAMTMPALISKHQKQVTVNRFKKTYAVVFQALKMSELENGNMQNWDYTLPARDFYNMYLKKYIKSAEEVPHSEIKKRVTYKYLNGANAEGAVADNSSYTAKIADGTFISIDAWYNNALKFRNIIFDINGFDGPNQIGKDVFYLWIVPEKTLIGYEDINNSGQGCLKSEAGYTCSAKIISDGWEIKDDYPW